MATKPNNQQSTPKLTPLPDNQLSRFRQTAKDLDSPDQKAFEQAMGKIARAKLEPSRIKKATKN